MSDKTNTSSQLEFIQLETNPGRTPDKCIIWLHGLGADGSDFVPIIDELSIPGNFNIKFIFPHAPMMPVTINNGFVMRAWFDIYGIDLADKIDLPGIASSSQLIEQIISSEHENGMPAKDIIIAGFSQGGVMALHLGLQYPKQLGGIIALSCFLPVTDHILDEIDLSKKNIPIFIGHGSQDNLVPFFLGEQTFKRLKQAGFNPEWHSYPVAHGVCAEEIKDIGKWLKDRM